MTVHLLGGEVAGSVPFWVNSNAAADASDAALRQVDVVAAARDAYQSWEDAPGAMIEFAYVSQTSARLGAETEQRPALGSRSASSLKSPAPARSSTPT